MERDLRALGTGVTVNPLTDYARQQLEFVTATGAMPQQAGYSTKVSEWGPSPTVGTTPLAPGHAGLITRATSAVETG